LDRQTRPTVIPAEAGIQSSLLFKAILTALHLAGAARTVKTEYRL
jgi:hypothetical protein